MGWPDNPHKLLAASLRTQDFCGQGWIDTTFIELARLRNKNGIPIEPISIA
jgi:hypothetical protein